MWRRLRAQYIHNSPIRVNQLLCAEFDAPAPDVKKEYAGRVTQEANKSLRADNDLEVFTKPGISAIRATDSARGKAREAGKAAAELLLLLQISLRAAPCISRPIVTTSTGFLGEFKPDWNVFCIKIP